MAHRNGHSNEDVAAREPLIARSDDPESLKKAESLRRKLRTYEAFLALRSGYMPTTQQLAGWARYALRSSGVLDTRNRRLSNKGREFLKDVRAWVEAVIDLSLSKNYDDKIQQFIWHTSHARLMTNVPEVSGAAKSGTRGSRQDATKLMERFRLSASLLWSSPEFRSLINDFFVTGRDIFADAASQVASSAGKVAERVRSTDPEQLEQKDLSSKAVKEKGLAYTDVTRKSIYESRDDIESYLREKFPKQRRDATVNRMKKVVQDIQENPDFQETVDFIIEILQKYITSIKDNIMNEGKSASVATDEHFEVAMKDLQAILMAFANGKELDPINDALRQVVKDIQNDQDLKDFYEHATSVFHRLLTQKGYVTSDQADHDIHKLYERSQELLDAKQDHYRPDVENLFNEVRMFIEAISEDKANHRVVEASKKVFSDLVLVDRYGNFTGFKKRVLCDLLQVVLPRFVTEIKYIPIPRIEYQDRDFDLILENIVLQSDHFLPSRTLFEAFTRAEFINSYNFNSNYSSATHLRIENINLFARDISFVVRKKTGLLSFQDRGFLDVFMTDKGASADIVLESTSDSMEDEDPSIAESYFHVRSVKVQIHNFSYNYHAYHSWAAKLLAPVVRPAVRKLLSNLLEQKIRSTVEMLDRELHAAAERMRVATIANRGGGSIENWIRAVLSRPEKSARAGARDEWRISVDEELLFPGEHGPGGIMAKMKRVDERVEVGGEDDSWRNKVFDVNA
jgi:hypothetical protein